MPSGLLVEPKQKRSKKSLDRMLEASTRQIETGNFDAVSIAEIARLANCSVGTFYGRFQNKAALFHVVQEQEFNKALNYIDERIDEFMRRSSLAPAPQSQTAAISFAIDLATDFYVSKKGVFRAIFLHTRTQQDPALMQRVQQFNTAGMHASFRILETTKPRPSADQKKQWREGLEIILVYIRETILFGDPVPTNKAQDFDAMKAVAVRMLSAFLLEST